MAQQPKGSEQAAAQAMEKFWLDAANNKLYQDWFGGPVTGLLYNGGLYDDTPMKTFLSKEITSAQMQRDVSIGIVDALQGEYVDFEKSNVTTGDNLQSALFASFAFPGIFQPAKVFNS